MTFDPAKPKSYAYCSDTSYKPNIVPLIKNVDLLYHESTFLSDREDLGPKTGHSTAKQAALIAKEATVEKLVLGHYSSRYSDISEFKKEALEFFDKVELAEAGKIIDLSS